MSLSAASKREYDRYLRKVSEAFGEAPLDVATRRDAILAFRRWHRSMDETPPFRKLLIVGAQKANVLGGRFWLRNG